MFNLKCLSFYRRHGLCKKSFLTAVFVLISSFVYADDYYPLENDWNRVWGAPKILSTKPDHMKSPDQTFYWGIATGIGKDWPYSDKRKNDQYINWLCRAGFNFQRIFGIDFRRNKLVCTWKKSPALFSESLKPIKDLIEELTESSIPYSLSINGISNKIDGVNLIKNAYPVSYKQYKYSQIIEPAAIELTLDWYRFLYAQKLEDGKSFAEDEDNYYITALGEDSLLSGYFFNKGRFLGLALEQELSRLFTSYLIEKYTSSEAFYNSWQIDTDFEKAMIGSLEDGVNLPPVKTYDTLPNTAKRDIISFFVEKDTAYAKGIRRVLDQEGFKGRFTFTNDWYGPAVLNTNATTGNLIDIHAYFDHSAKKRAGKITKEVIRNQSFIQQVNIRKDGFILPYKKNMYHMFASSVKNLPLIVSEWNHAAWSEYAYEGPLLITAYASLQGYKGLMLHTMRRWDMNIDQTFSNDSFAVLGNPVMLALSPTLSYVYRNQKIKPAKSSVDIVLSETTQDLMALAGDVGLNMGDFYKYAALNNGFVHKINIIPVGEKNTETPISNPKSCNFISDTGEIKLYLDDSHPRLEIDTPEFKAIAGTTPPEGINLGDQCITIHGHGVVTILSLDNHSIGSSKDLLVTAVRDFKNSNMKVKKLKKFRHIKDATLIEDSGRAPVLMRRVHGSIEFKLAHADTMQAQAVSFSGKTKQTILNKKKTSGTIQSSILKLDQEAAPWYRIKSIN
ncbi:hypothetical protein [uncultured Desulfobacter sp.]|uniref:hypothetical protein n=1 Tax=uncultured Desulfobacter sp. TaxID=240139 RepID=UPI002AA6E59D|nr:hypothetical protein [uncultured Desulfobacter sp.]